MARTAPRYPETHPWLTFRMDLDRLAPEIWMMLGEIRSKVHHLGKVPLPPAVAMEMRTVSLVKGVRATTAIEGNTLTEEQIRKIHDRELTLPRSRAYLEKEVRNVLDAIANAETNVHLDPELPVTPREILEMNRMVLDGLDLDDVTPGEVRRNDVVVADYVGPAATECERLLDRLCELLATPVPHGDPDWKIPLAVLKAIYAHLYIAWIHPFGDGNGRTARLLELRILRAAGVPDVAAHLLANHYNDTRDMYYRTLSQASKDHRGRGPLHFVRYAVEGLRDGLQAGVDRVMEVVSAIAWRDYVYQQFIGTLSASDRRQRDVAIHLGTLYPGGATMRELYDETRELISTYRNLSRQTLSRDLTRLIARGLVVRRGDRFVAAVGVMESFRPMVAGA